jgi:hypothetical protein
VFLLKQDQTLINPLIILGLLGIPVILSVIRLKSIPRKCGKSGEGKVEIKNNDHPEQKISQSEKINGENRINTEMRRFFLCDYFTKAFNWLTPTYNELTTYLTALTCFILFFTHPEFRQLYFEIITGAKADRASIAFIGLGLIATFGFFYSIIHVFQERGKTPFEKLCIGAFAMSANGIAGMVAGIEMLPSRLSILIVFPFWNFLMGALLLYQLGLNKFNISDDNASLSEVIWATGPLLMIFAISNIIFHLSWAMTFSICMFFSSIIIFYVKWIINYFQIQ